MSGKKIWKMFHSRLHFLLLSLKKYGQPQLLTLSQFWIPILNLSVFRSLTAFPIFAQGIVVGDRLFYYILSVIWLPHDQLQITIRRKLHSLDVNGSTISSSTQKSLRASYQG